MTPQRWKQIEAVFEQALEVAPDHRPAFLQEHCDDDDELRREVQSMLHAHEQAGSFIDQRSLFVGTDEIGEVHSAIAIGQLIGAYRVVRELGRGGMGAVYLAERADEQYRKCVAIKVIKRGMDTDSVLRQFRNERQILASFDHPNVARLLDGGATADGLPYLIMEYVEGLPIDAYCIAHALTVTERLKLFCQVCAAVSYAHRHAVIHRDIKPSNVLVKSDGVPKLLDFGIAKILQPGASVEALATIPGFRLMTPEYASPEQVRGEPVTTATDVYSLGVVLYLLLTGQTPYQLGTRTPEEISRAIMQEEPTPPSTARAQSWGNSTSQIPNAKLLRGDVDNIVMMALRKEPERRYQSVAQFSDDIRRYLEGRPVFARKDTISYRAAKFISRNKVATAAAALLCATLLVGMIATTWEAHRARVEEAIAKEEKKRAEKRFNDVRHLAHSVLFDYHDAIKDLPGATRVREKLVKDALGYLDSLASEGNGDPALQQELAAAYDRIGDVVGGAYLASLGDRAGALDSYTKALRIREALAAAQPRDVQSRRDLAENYRRIGWQLRDTDQETRGVHHLRKSVGLYTQLSREQPQNRELRDEVAYTCNLLGLVLQDLGDWHGALDQHRQALALREKLVAEVPGERKYRRGLAACYGNMGSALLMSGDAVAAHEAVQKSLRLEEALVQEEPTNAYYRRMVALGYGDDGGYQERLGDKCGAVESFRKSIAIYEQMMAADPANAQLWGDVGDPYRRIGDVLADQGDTLQALDYYRKSLQVYENGSQKAPQDLTLRLCLAICRAGIARLQARLGHNAPALDECQKSIALLAGTSEEPANATDRGLKAQAYRYAGEAYAAMAQSKDLPQSEAAKDWTAARDALQQSLTIYRDMQSRGVLSPQDAIQLNEVSGEIAQWYAALGK